MDLTSMAESLLIQRQAALLRDLVRLSAERARDETSTKSEFTSATAAAETEYKELRLAISRRFETDSAGEETDYQEQRKSIVARFTTDKAATEKEFQDRKRATLKKFDVDQVAAKKACDDTRWEAGTIYDSAKEAAKKRFESQARQLGAEMAAFQPFEQHATRLISECRRYIREGQAAVEEIPDSPDLDPLAKLRETILLVDSLSVHLSKCLFPRILKPKNFGWLVLLLLAAFTYPAWRLLGWPTGVVAGALGATALAAGLYFWLFSLARVQVARSYRPLCQAHDDVETWHKRCQERAAATLKKQQADSLQRRETELLAGEEKFKRRSKEIVETRDGDLRKAEEQHSRRMAEINQRHGGGIQHAEREHARRATEIKKRYEADTRELEEKHKMNLSSIKYNFEKAWSALLTKWRDGMAHALAEVTKINAESGRLFPELTAAGLSEWSPAQTIPPVVRFGEFRVAMTQIPHGIPQDEQLRSMTPEGFTLPAFITFPTLGSRSE